MANLTKDQLVERLITVFLELIQKISTEQFHKPKRTPTRKPSEMRIPAFLEQNDYGNGSRVNEASGFWTNSISKTRSEVFAILRHINRRRLFELWRPA